MFNIKTHSQVSVMDRNRFLTEFALGIEWGLMARGCKLYHEAAKRLQGLW